MSAEFSFEVIAVIDDTGRLNRVYGHPLKPSDEYEMWDIDEELFRDALAFEMPGVVGAKVSFTQYLHRWNDDIGKVNASVDRVLGKGRPARTVEPPPIAGVQWRPESVAS